VPKDRQEQTIASIAAKAQPGAKVGPFTIGGGLKEGKTLADFAGSEPGKLFKRPMHGCAYGFDRSGYLKEYVNGGTYWPRLNVEDLTATDWEEVPW
jgi:hypothetical protein